MGLRVPPALDRSTLGFLDFDLLGGVGPLSTSETKAAAQAIPDSNP
jgi:hypothetical protein